MPVTQTNDDNNTTIVDSSGTVLGVSGSPIKIDPTGTTTQPVSATSLPLPSGASTSALQTTGNTSLASIDTKQTDGTARSRITDGTNNVAVSNASPAGTEQGLIVRNIPSGTQNVNVTGAAAAGYSSTYRLIFSDTTINLSGAAYQTVYSYTGSGKLINFAINSSSDDLQLQVLINGVVIFQNITAKQINDIGIRAVYNLPLNGTGAGSFHFVPDYPIQFTSSMQIKAKRVTGGNMSISRYLITMTQES